MESIPFERSAPWTTTSSARTKFLENFLCEIPWWTNPLGATQIDAIKAVLPVSGVANKQPNSFLPIPLTIFLRAVRLNLYLLASEDCSKRTSISLVTNSPKSFGENPSLRLVRCSSNSNSAFLSPSETLRKSSAPFRAQTFFHNISISSELTLGFISSESLIILRAFSKSFLVVSVATGFCAFHNSKISVQL